MKCGGEAQTSSAICRRLTPVSEGQSEPQPSVTEENQEELWREIIDEVVHSDLGIHDDFLKLKEHFTITRKTKKV